MNRFAFLTAGLLLVGSQLPGTQLHGGEQDADAGVRQPDVSADVKLPVVSWVRVTDKAAFSPRDTAEDLVYQGKMWISNAYYHGNKLTRDLWNSSDGKTWTLVNDSTLYDGYSELAVYQDKMWAVKGERVDVDRR